MLNKALRGSHLAQFLILMCQYAGVTRGHTDGQWTYKKLVPRSPSNDFFLGGWVVFLAFYNCARFTIQIPVLKVHR